MSNLVKYSLYDDTTKKYVKFRGQQIALQEERWSHGTATDYQVYLTDNNQYIVRENFYTKWLDSNGRPESDKQYVQICKDKSEILAFLTSATPGCTSSRTKSDLLEKLEISHTYIQQLDYPREEHIKIEFNEKGQRK